MTDRYRYIFFLNYIVKCEHKMIYTELNLFTHNIHGYYIYFLKHAEMSKLRALERVQCMIASNDGVSIYGYIHDTEQWNSVYLLSDTSVEKVKARFMA